MILVIDDDIAVRTSLQLLLKSEGYVVAGAETPEDALHIIKTDAPRSSSSTLIFQSAPRARKGWLCWAILKS
jgi:CheY-like chemotaxis protein